MVYESDISDLLQQWEARLDSQTDDYRMALNECIYDLQCLRNKEFDEEALANETFNRQVKDGDWDGFFNDLLQEGMFFT